MTGAMEGSGSIFFPAISGAMTSSKNPTSTGWNDSTPFMVKKIGPARLEENRARAGPLPGGGPIPRKPGLGLGSGVLVHPSRAGGAAGGLAREAPDAHRADVDPDDRLLEGVLGLGEVQIGPGLFAL